MMVGYDSPRPGIGCVHPWWILMTTGVMVKDIIVFPCRRDLLSGRSPRQFDRQPIEAVKVSAVLVDSPVPTGLACTIVCHI